MASKKDFSQDALEAFDLERPKKVNPPATPPVEVAQPVSEPVRPVEKREKAVKPASPAGRGVSEKKLPEERGKLIRKTFYITPAQYKAIRLWTVESERPEDKDQSAIVRAALDKYLPKK